LPLRREKGHWSSSYRKFFLRILYIRCTWFLWPLLQYWDFNYCCIMIGRMFLFYSSTCVLETRVKWNAITWL
jgi:hypothetical protein